MAKPHLGKGPTDKDGRTPIRAVRIGGAVWTEAKAHAKAGGWNTSEYVRQALMTRIRKDRIARLARARKA